MKKHIVVLGIGNPLMSDEGIGSCIIERILAQSSDKYPTVDFIDAGTGGMSILHLIAGRAKAVIIDCAYMGTKPGTIKKFGPDDVNSVKKLAHQSLHEADILEILGLSSRLGQCPENIVIFGIEPEKVESGQHLSLTLAAKMDDYVCAVSGELIS